MINVNYQKRKNHELFKSLENPKTLFLSKAQNYNPIYTKSQGFCGFLPILYFGVSCHSPFSLCDIILI